MNGLRGRGAVGVLVAAILWGTTGTAAAFAPDVSGLAIGAAAMGIGGLLQAAVAIGSIRRHRVALGDQKRLLILCAIAVATFPLAFYSSMRLSGVAVGTVVTIGSAPPVAALIERVVDGTRLARRWVVGTVVGVVGVVALSFSHSAGDAGGAGAGAPEGWRHILGIGLGLLGGTTYAVYSCGAARVIGAEIPSRAAMGAIFGMGGLLLVPVLLATGSSITSTGVSLAVVGYLALVPMFVGYVLFGRSLALVSASTATTLTLAEPAAATILAVLVLHEAVSASGWLGLGLVLVSLVVVTTPSPSPRPGRLRTLHAAAAPLRPGVPVGNEPGPPTRP